MTLRAAALLVMALLLAPALAQPPSVRFELGHRGEFVTERWNPLRVTLRDIGSVRLEIRVDQGSLREGEKPMIYRTLLPGGTGISVFEDDLYLPGWRRFSWSARAEGSTIASGSFDPKEKSVQPLDLLISSRPGRWRGQFEAEARTLEVAAGDLPERVAAYDGVRTLLIDGSAASPRLEAVAAAAAAGVRVVLLDPLPIGHRELDVLAPDPVQRLGTGWLLRGTDPEATLAAALALKREFPAGALQELRHELDISGPEPLPQLTLLIVAAGYGILTLLLISFGGLPGTLASLSLALLASLVAWGYLRPERAQIERELTISVGAGDLAIRYQVHTLFTLPAGSIRSEIIAYPLGGIPYLVTPSGTRFDLDRWTTSTLLAKPGLDRALLTWEGGALENRSDSLLTDLYVVGLGHQGVLAAGERLVPRPAQDLPLSSLYTRLLDLGLPSGTGLARSRQGLVIALPDPRPELSAGRAP